MITYLYIIKIYLEREGDRERERGGERERERGRERDIRIYKCQLALTGGKGLNGDT